MVVGAVYGAVVTLLYLAVVRLAPGAPEQAPDQVGQAGVSPVPTGQVLRNRNIWMLAAAFGCFNFVFGAMNTYLPTFLVTVQGVGQRTGAGCLFQ